MNTMNTMKMRFKHLVMLTIVCMMASCITSCAAFKSNIKSLEEMTPREKATLAMSIYNERVESYKTRVALPDLSLAEKKILNAEYEMFNKLWPAIDIYYRASTDPTITVTSEVIKQVNDFITTYRY